MERANALEYSGLAVTDECSVAGLVRAHVAAKALDFPLIAGTTIKLTNQMKVVLLVENQAGWARLCRLITRGRRAAPKGSYRLDADAIAEASEGLWAIDISHTDSSPKTRAERQPKQIEGWVGWLREVFKERASLGVSLTGQANEKTVLRRLQRLSCHIQVPLVATGCVVAHHSKRRKVRDVLTAIQHNCQVKDLGHRLPPHIQALTPRSHIARIFNDWPESIQRTHDIAEQCQFRLDELVYTYPDEGKGAHRLRELTTAGAAMRWPEGVPEDVRKLIEHELTLIAELNYESYFLTVYDIVRFARSRDILCQGRGSAANSAVCYSLGITAVDPARFDVLFERFISKERGEPPDIDVDFEHERREEVLQYIYRRYGRERSAMTGCVITYRPRSALKDVGKALGLSTDLTDRLSRAARERRVLPDVASDFLTEEGFDPTDTALLRTLFLAESIQGFPRHLSQHTGGMVITQNRLDELCPIENAAMQDRTVLQWDKDDLDALGILKVDCLGLGMLTAIRRALALMKDFDGLDLSLATIPAEAPEVYEMATRADTVGVFQIESRAQMAMLPRFRPECFYDLVIEIAIVRPGPIQGGMVHPYLRRRAGKESVTFPSEDVRDVLRKTLGVPIFQEQVMKLAVVAAGFSPGEADQLRRSMAAWRRPGQMELFQEKLIGGMLKRGYDRPFAEGLFRQIQGFGEYGFPESHAASFALLTYVSCWIKRFHPAAYCAALLNSQPLGFYAPAQLIADARKHGVNVRSIDVTSSDWDATLEKDESGSPALRLGMRLVNGLKHDEADRIIAARERCAFTSLIDLRRRSHINNSTATLLADAGGFDALSSNRRRARWESGSDLYSPPILGSHVAEEETPGLAPPTLPEIVEIDIRRTGLSLTAHPMELIREELTEVDVIPSAELTNRHHGSTVRVAGVVICRQRPATASGILFVTLEDEEGFINLVVRKKDQERLRRPLFRSAVLLIEGRLEKLEGTIHVLVSHAKTIHAKNDLSFSGRRSRSGH